MKIKLNSKKVVFFLLAYYICLNPIMYMLSYYFTHGNILFGTENRFYNAIYMEQIVMLLTVYFVATRNINIGRYMNLNLRLAFFLFTCVFLIVNLSFFDVGLLYFGQYYSFSTLIIARGFVFVLLGMNIHAIDDMFQDNKIRIVFYSIAALYITTILLSSILNPEVRNYSWYLGGITRGMAYDYVDSQLDYNYVADTVALLFLFIMSRVKGLTLKMLILIFGLFILLLSVSRTSFICFGFAGLLLWTRLSFIVNKKKMILPVMVLVLLITFAFTYAQFFSNQVTREYGDSYRFNFLNIKTDGSYNQRAYYFEKRWHELRDNWLFGRYMSEVAEGRPGTYFHNWLSFWSAFGIGPFLLSVILIVSSLSRSVQQLFKNSVSPKNQWLFLWTIYMVLVITFSRSYSFYYIWFIIFGSSIIDRKYTMRRGHSHFTSKTENKVHLRQHIL
jgi:hypothetical protein